VIELALVALASAVTFGGARVLPAALPAGTLALVCAALLLGQGLARDLSIKFVAHRDQSCAVGAQFCAESALGIGGIIAGALLLASGAGQVVTLTAARWGLLVAMVGLGGFFIKDVVFDVRSRRLRIVRHG
jgi:hypothetical protein